MLKPKDLQNVIYFDIETAPIVYEYNDLSEQLKTQFKGKKVDESLKKNAERNAEIEQKLKNGQKTTMVPINEETIISDTMIEIEKSFKEKSSFNPCYAKIVCISAGFINDDGELLIHSFCGDDEVKLLNDFCNYLREYENELDYSIKLAGHNIKDFDIPFILKRLLINQIFEIPRCLDLYGMKTWDLPILDSMTYWGESVKLDLLAAIFNIESPKMDMDGSMVKDVFYIDKDYERLARYCEADVKASARVFAKLVGNPTDFNIISNY